MHSQKSSNELSNLKNRIFDKSGSKDDEFGRMCEVVYYLGGYQKFLETPIPLIIEFGKFANWKEERFFKNLHKIIHGKKGSKR